MRLLLSLQPALAALLAACVLLLGWAAHAPDLHEALCQHSHDHADHPAAHDPSDSDYTADATEHTVPAAAPDAADDSSCAVTLFAAGCDAPTAPHLLVEPALSATRVAHFTEFMLARTLRGPTRVCGPPALT